MLIVVFFIRCKDKSIKPKIDGTYHYSDYSDISFYLPKNISPYNLDDYDAFNPNYHTIKNPKLKQLVKRGFIENAINPNAENFQLFYDDNKSYFTAITFNEFEYVRLNEKLAQNLSLSIKRELQLLKSLDTIGKFLQTSEQFLNYDQHQKFRNKGCYINNNDTLFWETFIVSKFVKTFTVNVMSSQPIGFNKYLMEMKRGKVEN